jgi:hypothetical protein
VNQLHFFGHRNAKLKEAHNQQHQHREDYRKLDRDRATISKPSARGCCRSKSLRHSVVAPYHGGPCPFSAVALLVQQSARQRFISPKFYEITHSMQTDRRKRRFDNSPVLLTVSNLLAGLSGNRATVVPSARCVCYIIPGNSSILASSIGISYQKYDYNQCFTIKFPTQRNRELIVPEQGIKSAHQGRFPADQGIPDGSGYQSGWKAQRLDLARGRRACLSRR